MVSGLSKQACGLLCLHRQAQTEIRGSAVTTTVARFRWFGQMEKYRSGAKCLTFRFMDERRILKQPHLTAHTTNIVLFRSSILVYKMVEFPSSRCPSHWLHEGTRHVASPGVSLNQDSRFKNHNNHNHTQNQTT
jgi:hypothetical protein